MNADLALPSETPVAEAVAAVCRLLREREVLLEYYL